MKEKLAPKIICLILTLICINSLVYSQEKKYLTLDEVLKLAAAHDLQLKSDSIQYQLLKAKVDQSKKALLPDLGLNLNYTRISDNITPFSVSLPTGSIVLNPQILNQSFNSLQLKQLIWSGGKVNYGIKIAKKELEAGMYDLERDKVNAAYNVAALWYNLYVTKASSAIIEANVKTLTEREQDLKNLVKQGLALENDVLKISLAITSLQSNLADVTNAIAALNFNLSILTGLPRNTIFEFPVLLDSVALADNKIENYISTAIANRAELKNLGAFKEVALMGLKIARLNYTPTISAIASGNYNQPELRVFPNQDKFNATWFVGINLNWSLSNFYKNPAKVAESQKALAKTETATAQLMEGIMIEVNTAFTDYLQAKQKIVIAKKGLEQANENYRVEENRLKSATITSTEFLDANTKKLQASLNLNAANANAQLAIKKLQKSIGQ
jgi:outer membrane protein